MKNFLKIQRTVQNNCDLIDAEYGQNYGLCIYLLKMRDYYRWRNQVPLHQELKNEEIHKWIAETETYWEQISSNPLQAVTINGNRYEPFASQAINEQITPEGYVYSGGLGYGGIPVFFFADLEKEENRNGFTILISAKEHARGLYGAPALYRDNVIFVRKEALKRWLWSRYDEWSFNKRDNTMGKALGFYPFSDDPESAVNEMTEAELETLVQHEIGEGLLGKEFGLAWQDMIADYAYSQTEILLRAVRDLAVDCMTTLPYLIGSRHRPSIHLFFANYSDMRKELYPQLFDAYKYWENSSSYKALTDLTDRGKVYWYDIGKKVIELFNRKGKQAQNEINNFIRNSNHSLSY
jgi:hypothetical protein